MVKCLDNLEEENVIIVRNGYTDNFLKLEMKAMKLCFGDGFLLVYFYFTHHQYLNIYYFSPKFGLVNTFIHYSAI